jgi:hypothetical protein
MPDGMRVARTLSCGLSVVDQFSIAALIRWDEKAGLHGMRYAPSVSTCSRHKKKETGDEED